MIGLKSVSDYNGKVIRVDANPEAGFNFEYYLYIPNNQGEAGIYNLLVSPNNTGGTNDDHNVHVKRVLKTMNSGKTSYPKRIAYDLGVPMLIPTFDRPSSEDRMYTHALDSDTLKKTTGDLARVDLQLIAMIEDARLQLEEKDVYIAEQVIMDGYSASGSFTNRFAALHPELLIAVSTGGVNSMPIIPLESIDEIKMPFHVGVADLEILTKKTFDVNAYKKVKQYIYMGSEDDNDTLPYGDAYTDEEREITVQVLGNTMAERWEKSIEIYESLQIPADMVTYDGLGHEINDEIMDDIVAFYHRVLVEH